MQITEIHNPGREKEFERLRARNSSSNIAPSIHILFFRKLVFRALGSLGFPGWKSDKFGSITKWWWYSIVELKGHGPDLEMLVSLTFI